MNDSQPRTTSIRSAPRTTVERVRRSACLINASQYDAAITELVGERHPASTDLTDEFLDRIDGDRSANDSAEAIARLRQAIAVDSENAGLHFQLGTLLARAGRWEEAELRFTQVLSITRDNVDAMIALAMCHAYRSEHGTAVEYLQRAQAARPADAGITLLLARSAKAAQDEGTPIHVCAAMDAADPGEHKHREAH